MSGIAAPDVRAAFLRSVAMARVLLAAPEVAVRWDEPSVLPDFTVRGLAGHLGRCGWIVEQYLDAGIPDDAIDVGDAAGYYSAINLTTDVHDALNTSVRERGESEAEGGASAVVERLDGAITRLTARLADLPADARITVLAGTTLPVDEYLVTRIVEALVHTDDLALSVGLEPPVPDSDAAAVAIDALVGLGRRRHGDLAVLRALTRRERDDVDALRAF